MQIWGSSVFRSTNNKSSSQTKRNLCRRSAWINLFRIRSTTLKYIVGVFQKPLERCLMSSLATVPVADASDKLELEPRLEYLLPIVKQLNNNIFTHREKEGQRGEGGWAGERYN